MKYILWDFDGTLGYRNEMWSGTLYSLLLKNNIDNILQENIKPLLQPPKLHNLLDGFTWHYPEKSHKELFGEKTWAEYYESHFYNILKKLGLNEILCGKLSKEVIKEYTDITQWHIFDDVIGALENLTNNNIINIILSNHIPQLNMIVKGLKIDKYFQHIYSSANIGYEKPNKKIYEYVFEKNNLDKTDCIIIGDSYNADIIGGINIGIKSILVRTENTNNHKYYCNDLHNIEKIIAEII